MTKGLDTILGNLTKLQVHAPAAARAAVTEAAEEFRKQLTINTPEESGVLEEDTAVSGFKGASHGIVSKDIGYGHRAGWRAHFPDAGTIYQPPQDFKEKTINQMTPVAKEIYARNIREGLNL
ncbi:HK97-gp10 family putative phage morphogenesis protein [Streptococcus anginosus]|uniref:HK97-gp10 family putative phage morphogenesis protein n=1 Tax=Streptococcus anginosus TaxID=1328 RepID=UPI002000FA72|nr:HK97-gp10 family putative phage morphogenesis protein [Streptococcus anginosus]